MTHTVSTSLRLHGDTPLARAYSFAAVEARQGKPLHDGEPKGGIDLGDDHEFCLIGTASELRQLAKAIEDGAMEIERQDAEARSSQPREQQVPCKVCTTAGPERPLVRHFTFNLDRIHDDCRSAVSEALFAEDVTV